MKENKKIPPKQTAENIPEVEHSEIPTSNEETISSEENILPEIEQSEIPPLSGTEIIETSNTATKNDMEVHHHSHDPAAPHHKKNWKTYFWEFLMLFLAVFCGFLAEYQLEHKIERDREKKFIQTFIEDLKTDTAAIRQILVFRQEKMKRMDSLMLLIKTQNIKGHENELYFFGRTLVRTLWFRSNDRTITQLKNSGSLRLIRNEQAADSMMSYQKLVETIMGNQEDDRIERRAADPLLSRMFDPFVFDEMVKANGVNRPAGNPPLRSYDPTIPQDLAYYIHQLKGSNFIIQGRLELLNEKAKNIMAFLEKEYHLK